MKRKIVGIFACILLIVIAILTKRFEEKNMILDVNAGKLIKGE